MLQGLLLNASTFDAALLGELARAWGELNRLHFGGVLRRPVLTLIDTRTRLGSWHRVERTLSMSRRFVLERTWGTVIEVMRHEMAHQYVDEVLHIHDQTAHGPAFQRVCRERAIDGRATGAPGLGSDGPVPAVLRKVHALLALADSPNRNEAEAAMRAAHRLMRKYNVERSTGADGYTFAQLGRPTGRVPAHHRVLAGILAEHFFIQPIWVSAYDAARRKWGRVLEVCGRPENMDIAEHVHGFMLQTGERLWRDHKRAQGLRGNRDRRRFLQGMMMGFHDQLQEAAEAAERTGLVWVGDADLDAYLSRRHPSRARGRAVAMTLSSEWEAGRAAGRRIVLRRAVPHRGQAPIGLLPG